MAQITITEALADIKTIGKRIDKKKQFIAQYLFRQEKVRDPLEKDGGSIKAISAARQGISDLNKRLVTMRARIQQSNAETPLTIGSRTMSVADWLTWRKEVAPGEQKLLETIRLNIDGLRKQQQQKQTGVQVISINTGNEAKPDDVLVNIDEGSLVKELEELEEVLGTLDGKLSLNNATRTIEAD